MKTRSILLLLMAWLISISALASPPDTLVVKIMGMHEDARFEPAIIQVQPGDVIRFEVAEGLHTVTAYHPDNRRPLRIPENAQSFDSGMLTAGQVWFLTLDEIGVYDYFCLPHERMGHAGRIISGSKKRNPKFDDSLIPEAVVKTLNEATLHYSNQ
ncbi:MAG: plastocyanin/azurin family copper-binding protein [Balneolaceae bacterium]